MPWNPKDADSFTQRADSPKLKREWAHIADKVLEETGDEGQAIKEANGRVKKQQAKKSCCEELIDLAKSVDFEDLAKSTTYGPRNLPKFAGSGLTHRKFKKPGFHHAQFRHPKNMSHMSSTGRRNYKSCDAEEEEKGIGNSAAAFSPITVRKYTRVNQTRQTKNPVTSFRKRKFAPGSDTSGIEE